MTKEPITFDKLPQAVSYLTEQVEKIYQLVETLQPQRLDHQHQLIDIDKAYTLKKNTMTMKLTNLFIITNQIYDISQRERFRNNLIMPCPN